MKLSHFRNMKMQRSLLGGVLSAENKKAVAPGATALTVNSRLLSLILF